MSRDYFPISRFWNEPVNRDPHITSFGNDDLAIRLNPPIQQGEVDSLSLRISKLIEENEQILFVGSHGNSNTDPHGEIRTKKTKHHKSASSLNGCSTASSRRQSRGPWRYEERIIQLGYQPSKFNSKFSRRNSLPVNNTVSHGGRDSVPFYSPLVRARRASLPVIHRLPKTDSAVMHESSFGATMAAHRPQRSTVIQLNPAYQNASLVSESNDDEEVQSTDSESSEYIVVDVEEPINSTDGTKTAAQRLASILSKKQSILRRWEAESTRKSPPKRCDDNHTAMKIHPAIRKDQAMTVDPITRKRRSPVDQRFEPYLRKHEIDENENRTSKTDESVPDINSSLVNVIEEIKAAAAAQTTRLNSPNPFPNLNCQKTELIISPHTRGNSAPNAVVQMNRNNNRNGEIEKLGVDADDDHRPFRCTQCGVGFRIGGHLSRHVKSRGHLQKTMLRNPMAPIPSSIHAISPTPMLSESPPHVVTVVSPPPSMMDTAQSKRAQTPPPQPPPPKLVQPIITGVKPPEAVLRTCPPTSPTSQQPPPHNLLSTPPAQPIMVEQSGTRRFRCDVCDIGFRFQGHLDRHLRSTTHLSMEEAVKRTGKRSEET